MTTSRKLWFVLVFAPVLPVFLLGLVASAARWAFVAGANSATELLLERVGGRKK